MIAVAAAHVGPRVEDILDLEPHRAAEEERELRHQVEALAEVGEQAQVERRIVAKRRSLAGAAVDPRRAAPVGAAAARQGRCCNSRSRPRPGGAGGPPVEPMRLAVEIIERRQARARSSSSSLRVTVWVDRQGQPPAVAAAERPPPPAPPPRPPPPPPGAVERRRPPRLGGGAPSAVPAARCAPAAAGRALPAAGALPRTWPAAEARAQRLRSARGSAR